MRSVDVISRPRFTPLESVENYIFKYAITYRILLSSRSSSCVWTLICKNTDDTKRRPFWFTFGWVGVTWWYRKRLRAKHKILGLHPVPKYLGGRFIQIEQTKGSGYRYVRLNNVSIDNQNKTQTYMAWIWFIFHLIVVLLVLPLSHWYKWGICISVCTTRVPS